MKQAQNARKQRGRPSSRQNGKSGGPGNRSEQKVRGNPKQLVEKYKNQARESLQAGDRTQAEYFFQFADHYYRVANEMRSNSPSQGDQEGQQNNARRRRRGRHNDEQQTEAQVENTSADQKTDAVTGDAGEASKSAHDQKVEDRPVDPAKQAQPVESHPELALDGGEEKKPPRRRRNSAPRRKPAVAETDAPSETAAVETDVA